MTYATYETSAEDRTPIELFEIAVGANEYFFTSAAEPYESLGRTYEPLAGLQRQEIQLSQEARQNILNVKMPASHPFIKKFIRIVPGNIATMKIFNFHRLDGGTPQRTLQFAGSVQSVAFSKYGHLAEVGLVPISTLTKRIIPRDTFQALCNNNLYGNRCKVSEAAFTYSGSISSMVLDVVTVDGLNAAKGGTWAVGGFLTNSLREDYRMILAQSSDAITVLKPFPPEITVVGETFDVIAGCDHSIDVCHSKFSNVVNFRGWAWVPWRNIFAKGI